MEPEKALDLAVESGDSEGNSSSDSNPDLLFPPSLFSLLSKTASSCTLALDSLG